MIGLFGIPNTNQKRINLRLFWSLFLYTVQESFNQEQSLKTEMSLSIIFLVSSSSRLTLS